MDAILRWTGKGLGWDIYGAPRPPDALASSCVARPLPSTRKDSTRSTHEYCADHGKPLPVVLPEALALTNGPFYSGSPFLGQVGLMPPGDGGLNPNAGYTYMWHSHNEKEITNFDIFPGGMMTMLVVEPPGTPHPVGLRAHRRQVHVNRYSVAKGASDADESFGLDAVCVERRRCRRRASH